jgi:MFS family permease
MSVAEDERAGADSPYDPPQAKPPLQFNQEARPGFFYGWVMIVVAAIAMVATFPGRTHGLGTVTERLLADPSLGLTREGFGQFNFWATLLGAAFCLGFGRLIDRVGIRIVLPVTLTALGLVVVAMAWTTSPAVFFVLLLLTRGFGQSALSVASISIPGKWFEARLSWATALYSILLTIGFIAAFTVAGKYADESWRTMWGAVGLIVLALGAVAWFVTRNRPESIGTSVDGRAEAILKEESAATGVGLFAAMGTIDFWVFAVATSLFATISSGLSLFNQSILEDLGFDKQVYYDSMKIGIGVGLLAQFATGWAATRISMGKLTAVGLLGLATALVALTQLNAVWQVKLFAAGNAFAGGIVTVIFFAVWAKRFGRKHLGSVQGVAQMTTVLASAIGPLLFAEVRVGLGSYTPALVGLAIAAVGVAIVAFFLPNRSFDDASALPSPAVAGQD